MATQKTYKINIDVESKTLGQLEDDLANINDELKDVDRNSEAFKNLSKQAQVLNQEIEKTNNQIEGFTLDKKLEAADGAAKVFAGSLSAAVGTLGVLGVESEVFGEFEEKAASAIAVGLGIKDVSEGFGQFTKVMKSSGIAAKLFGSTTSKALIATGVGAFIVALGTVVAYWDDITKAVNKFANNVPFVGKAIEAVKDTFNDLFDAARPVLEFLGILPDEAERAQIAIQETAEAATTELTREISIAQAAGASAQSLYLLRKQLIEQELAALKAAGAEKEEIYAKETELLTLQAAEKKRILDEEEQARIDKKAKDEEERAEDLEKIEEEMDKVRETIEPLGLVTLKVASAQDQLKDSVKGIIPAMNAADKATQKQTNALKTQQFQEEENRRSMAATGAALGQLGAVLDQESTAAKGLAIGSAIINTYLGVTEALRQPSTLPSPFDVITKVANIATILATGFKTVNAIKSTPAKGGGGGGGAAGITSGGGSRGAASSIPGAPQQPPQFDAPQTFEQTGPTVKAYVVSGDVRSSSEADAKIERRRTID